MNPNGSDVLEIEEKRPRSKPYWSLSGTRAPAPEQESDPDLSYIMVHQHEKAESDTFYLDPDQELIMVLELEPEESGCEQAPESKCGDPNEDSLSQEVVQSGSEEMESEDYCAVCLNGGDLLCCDLCPKVYHLACHIPSLLSIPTGDWTCSLCMTDQSPIEASASDGCSASYALSDRDQRRCEKLTLLLYVNTLSAPFHEPVSRLARNYYQVIRRPMDLSLIRRKLDRSDTLHYITVEQFVYDVILMLRNCATFNYPDSEVAQAGQNLEVFFLRKLREIFPDRIFPSASRDRMERARLQWRSSRRKEASRRKRRVRSGRRK